MEFLISTIPRSLCLILSLAGALTGCATVSQAPQHNTQPLKIVMVAIPSSAEVSDLEQISSVQPSNDDPSNKALEKTFVDHRLSRVFKDSVATMNEALQASGRFSVCRSTELAPTVISTDVANKTEKLTPEMRKKLEDLHCGDALLRFQITDYGNIPKTWDTWITVGTGLWIGGVTALAYSKPATRPYIGAYLLSEVIQESAETYAGYSLLGSQYRPVRVEAELIDLRTGNTLWQNANTGLANSHSIFPFKPPAEEKDKIAAKLDLSLTRAIQSLVNDLSSADIVIAQ